MRRNHKQNLNIVFIFAGALAILAMMLLPLGTQAANPAAPPPLPTFTPIPTATVPSTPKIPSSPKTSAVTGGLLQLHVTFPTSWPWPVVHWQDIRAVVQWQDADGIWHDVMGWRGGLNTVSVDVDNIVTGKQMWWFAESQLGVGPFRWLVFQNKGGPLLTESESFWLPDHNGAIMTQFLDLSQ